MKTQKPLATMDRQGNIRTFCICKERYAVHCTICRDKFAKQTAKEIFKELEKDSHSIINRSEGIYYDFCFHKDYWNEIKRRWLKWK